MKCVQNYFFQFERLCLAEQEEMKSEKKHFFIFFLLLSGLSILRASCNELSKYLHQQLPQKSKTISQQRAIEFFLFATSVTISHIKNIPK